MMTASHIADTVGRKAIAKAAQVGETAVSNAVVRGKFPSSWYFVVAPLAASHGIECPPALFGMKTPQQGAA